LDVKKSCQDPCTQLLAFNRSWDLINLIDFKLVHGQVDQPIFEFCLKNDLICEEDRKIFDIEESDSEDLSNYMLDSHAIKITGGKCLRFF
jgi:hypothetical protein